MTKEHLNIATVWYNAYKEHIDKLVKITHESCQPTFKECKNHPSTWKAENWKWFLTRKK